MKILLVDTAIKEAAVNAEPAHLLGIYHFLKRDKHKVRLLSFPSQRRLTSIIKSFRPHFVGFTAYRIIPYDFLNGSMYKFSWDSLQDYAQIIEAIKGKGIKIGIGGQGASLNPIYFAKAYQPDILVKGLGSSPCGLWQKMILNLKNSHEKWSAKRGLTEQPLYMPRRIVSGLKSLLRGPIC